MHCDTHICYMGNFSEIAVMLSCCHKVCRNTDKGLYVVTTYLLGAVDKPVTRCHLFQGGLDKVIHRLTAQYEESDSKESEPDK